MASRPHSTHEHWYLEGCVERDDVPRRFALGSVPFRIGRHRGADVVLPIGQVSGQHAEIDARGSRLVLRDLGSTNGTFRNGDRVSAGREIELEPGDVIHFAHAEFVLGCWSVEDDDDGEEKTALMGTAPGPRSVGHPARARALRHMIARGDVVAHFQPVLALSDEALLGYEALGRGDAVALAPAPGPLFELAERLGLAPALSEAFRAAALEAATILPAGAALFLNSHPSEVGTPTLVAALEAARAAAPERPMVLEIHEGTVTAAAAMRALRSALADLSIGLAYDDFGAGQARLLELVEVPPDYLKLDMSMVRDLDRAPPARRRMIGVLARMAGDLGIACVAEGIEREGELEACRDLGLDYAQGYLLGRPQPADVLVDAAPATRPPAAADPLSSTMVVDIA